MYVVILTAEATLTLGQIDDFDRLPLGRKENGFHTIRFIRFQMRPIVGGGKINLIGKKWTTLGLKCPRPGMSKVTFPSLPGSTHLIQMIGIVILLPQSLLISLLNQVCVCQQGKMAKQAGTRRLRADFERPRAINTIFGQVGEFGNLPTATKVK